MDSSSLVMLFGDLRVYVTEEALYTPELHVIAQQ